MNTRKIRQDFPIFEEKKGLFGIKKKPIIFFDNACNTLRPRQVVTAMNQYYYDYPACAGRSAHALARRATDAYEDARKTISKFISAKDEKEVIFTRNTTEGINLVANSFNFKKGDIVLSGDKEHNSNLIPWLKLKEKGVKHEVIKSKNEVFDLDAFAKKLNKNVKLVAIQHTANLDGTSTPIKKIIDMAHDNGSLVLVDAAQSVPREPTNVKKLDVDFLAFSGHKMLGPTGTGVLYGKKEHLEKLNQFMVGGETVKESYYDKFVVEDLPMKFEAGLQDYAGFIGLAEAANYLKKNGLDELAAYETVLNKKITEGLSKHPEIELIGPKNAELRGGIFSFNVKGMNPHEVAHILDSGKNIAIRSGAHCVHSWFNAHNLQGSARASLYLYNTQEECDEFISAVEEIIGLRK